MKYYLDPGAYAPEYAHDTDAGMDLRTCSDFTLPATQGIAYSNDVQIGSAIIDTGIHVEIPKGHAGFLKSKSGLNVKKGITSEGVVDEGYTGSIVVKLYNHTNSEVTFRAGDKITQLVILPVNHVSLEQVDTLETTERGDNGFGSTGR